MPLIRKVLDANPKLCETVGDLDRLVTISWIEALGNGDPLVAEALKKRAADLRAELEGEAPTPIEKMLVGAVVASWLEMSHAQIALKATAAGEMARTATSVKRADSAQKRYLTAMKTLTTIRAQLPRGLVPVSRLRIFTGDLKSG